MSLTGGPHFHSHTELTQYFFYADTIPTNVTLHIKYPVSVEEYGLIIDNAHSITAAYFNDWIQALRPIFHTRHSPLKVITLVINGSVHEVQPRHLQQFVTRIGAGLEGIRERGGEGVLRIEGVNLVNPSLRRGKVLTKTELKMWCPVSLKLEVV